MFRWPQMRLENCFINRVDVLNTLAWATQHLIVDWKGAVMCYKCRIACCCPLLTPRTKKGKKRDGSFYRRVCRGTLANPYSTFVLYSVLFFFTLWSLCFLLSGGNLLLNGHNLSGLLRTVLSGFPTLHPLFFWSSTCTLLWSSYLRTSTFLVL